MKLKENPFFVLGVSCRANRSEIASAAEEKSFFLEQKTCQDAQSQLLNPRKRLSAEIDWFPDLQDEIVISIRRSVSQGEVIPLDSLRGLAKLNASLYNFESFVTFDNYKKLASTILSIDSQYSKLNAGEIASSINGDRNYAGLSSVQTREVESELSSKRGDIKQLIGERLSTLEQDDYIEFVTSLAENCLVDSRYNDGVVLSDIVNQYEIQMQSRIDQMAKAISALIKNVRAKADRGAGLDSEIKSLITQVKSWDKLVQPLQLKSQASGMPHQASEQMAHELRELALYLHNEADCTQEALKISNEMKGVFAELDMWAGLFTDDIDALQELLKGQKDAKAFEAAIKALEIAERNLMASPTDVNRNRFTECIRKINAILKDLSFDSSEKKVMRMAMCARGRSAAVSLHNDKHRTSMALEITRMLKSEFGDIPEMKKILAADESNLALQARALGAQSSADSDLSGCGCWLVVGIIVLILILASAGCSAAVL